MLTLIFVALATLGITQGNVLECYYRELGCKAVETEGKPPYYNCPQLSESKCYFYGKPYAVGSELEGTQQCVDGCSCSENESASWTCPRFNCPLQLACDDSNERVVLYKNLSDCCGDVKCNKTEIEKRNPEQICEFKGEQYIYGELINIGDCSTCLCSKEFDGTFQESICREILCGVELSSLEEVRKGCAPVFQEGSQSCPTSSFRCPNDDDGVVTPGNVILSGQCDEVQCTFGHVKMDIGQKLTNTTEYPCYDCTCNLPPLPNCVMNPTCTTGSK